MLTLLGEVHFWTLKDSNCIRDTDFGAFRYHDKKSCTENILFAGKKGFTEKRNVVWSPGNKRPVRLKDSLKEFEEYLDTLRVVWREWRDCTTLQLMFNTGLIANITLSSISGDVREITFDKYMVGKLQSEYVADVVVSNTHALCSYNDNQITVVNFMKPSLKRGVARKWGQLDAKHHIVELAGPSGRRLERKLSINTAGDMVLIWWRCTRDEVYPWSPVVKDQDRANVHVYSLRGTKAELLCYYRTEFDPVCVVFSQVQPNVINSVEQKISRKGEVTVERCTYEITKNRLQRSSVTSIPLQTHVCCVAFSPDDSKLLLGCIDGSLVLFDDGQGSTHLVKAAFIPTLVCWHPDGALIIVANERCQLQCFDCALACVKIQLVGEDLMPSVLLDLSVYFRHQPTLLHIGWNKKSDALLCPSATAIQDGFLLLLFERGPLAVLKLIGGGGMLNDVHNQGLTSDAMISQYLNVGQADRAVNLLLSLNWDLAGYACLASLHRIVNHLLRLPLTPDREVQLETALGSFHVPARPLSHSTEMEFADPVRDLTRRFFHHLLRYRIFDKAFRLAIDLNEYDLFMDLHHYARSIGDTAMADAALEKADQVSDCSSHSESSDCDCDRSSCSCSTGSSSSVSRRGRGVGGGVGGGGRVMTSVPPPLPIVHKSLQQQLSNSNPRQKVKFSDTVTHITVQEELSGLSEEEERRINTVGLPPVFGCPPPLPPYIPFPRTLKSTAPPDSNFHYQLFNTNTSVPRPTLNTAPQFKDYLGTAPTTLANDRDEEENDTIKVVHFGVV